MIEIYREAMSVIAEMMNPRQNAKLTVALQKGLLRELSFRQLSVSVCVSLRLI